MELLSAEKRRGRGRAAGCMAALLAAALMWAQPVQALAAEAGEKAADRTAAAVGAGAEGADVSGSEMDESRAKEEVKRSLSDEELDELLDFIKEKWDAGELDGEASIREAIEEGEEKFGVVLKDSVKEQIADGIEKLDGLGLDHDTAVGLAKKLYQEHGDEIAENFQELYEQCGTALAQSVERTLQEQVVEPAKEAARTAVEDTAKGFWQDLKNSVISFFKNIFS